MQNQQADVPETTTDPAKQTLNPLAQKEADSALPVELGGSTGPEPTRFGDWEKGGRCTDF